MSLLGSLYRLLNGGQFAMTPAADLLRRDRPGSLRSIALFYGDAMLWHTHGHLAYFVETGKPAFAEVHGRSFYHYLKQHASAARLFNEAMTGFSEQEAPAIRDAYDFSSTGLIMDIGGGRGALMRVLLKARPSMRA